MIWYDMNMAWYGTNFRWNWMQIRETTQKYKTNLLAYSSSFFLDPSILFLLNKSCWEVLAKANQTKHEWIHTNMSGTKLLQFTTHLKFNSSPLKSYRDPKKRKGSSSNPSFFRGKLAVKLQGLYMYLFDFFHPTANFPQKTPKATLKDFSDSISEQVTNQGHVNQSGSWTWECRPRFRRWWQPEIW